MGSIYGFSQVKTEKVSLKEIPEKVRTDLPKPLSVKFNNNQNLKNGGNFNFRFSFVIIPIGTA
jgi:hypothetical protein